MAGTNDFLPFAVGGSANVITQSAYAALTTLLANGFQSGVAQSNQLNKVWRQSSLMAAALGSIIANANLNAVDDGTTATLAANIRAALSGGFAGVASATADTTLTLANANKLFYTYGTGNIVITLPAVSALQAGAILPIFQAGSGTVTINRAGSDVIQAGSGTVTSLTLKAGDTAFLVSNGAANWELVDGSVAMTYAEAFKGANWTTPAQFDNTTKLATTEFVQRAMGQLRGYTLTSGPSALGVSDVNKIINVSTGSTITLPASSGLVGGCTLLFFGTMASSTASIVPSGTDTMTVGKTTVSSLTLGPGDSVLAVYQSSGQWLLMGTSQLGYSNKFASSLAASGYQKLPSGLIVQWGLNTGSPSGSSVSFPITFPTAVLGFAGMCGGTANPIAIPSASTSGFTFYNSGGAASSWWIALGY